MGERVLDFHSYFDRTTKPAEELSALDPVAIYTYGNSLVVTSVTGRLEPRFLNLEFRI